MRDLGRFVVFEGIDGCGKSTQARRVARERDALFAFEPGDTPLGTQLRAWLLDANEPMTPETEALLMLADRSHHVRSVIQPALEAGRDVIADRFSPSTLAYQGYGRGVDLSLLRAATDLAIGSTRPDLVIVLDVSPDVARQRESLSSADRFESAQGQFLERVREGYLELATQVNDPWVVVDASAPYDVVDEVVDGLLDDLWRSH